MKLNLTTAILSVFMLVACGEKEKTTGFVDNNGKSMTKEQAQDAVLEAAMKKLEKPIPKLKDIQNKEQKQ